VPDDGTAALLVIYDGAYCATAELRRMAAAAGMGDDDGCTLSMTADDEGQGGRWHAYPVTIWRNWSIMVTDRR
jgi:hypothetical protein